MNGLIYTTIIVTDNAMCGSITLDCYMVDPIYRIQPSGYPLAKSGNWLCYSSYEREPVLPASYRYREPHQLLNGANSGTAWVSRVGIV